MKNLGENKNQNSIEHWSRATYFSILSFLFLNFVSKIMDIGTEYFRETLAEKILRENLAKKISKPKP
ncbi:MAG: hypothetical protein IPM97_15845 [Bdellovibrionaceae bacterium]|nr:hypothetical protein [Pseudobdellovibrionaceae bacterium]